MGVELGLSVDDAASKLGSGGEFGRRRREKRRVLDGSGRDAYRVQDQAPHPEELELRTLCYTYQLIVRVLIGEHRLGPPLLVKAVIDFGMGFHSSVDPPSPAPL